MEIPTPNAATKTLLGILAGVTAALVAVMVQGVKSEPVDQMMWAGIFCGVFAVWFVVLVLALATWRAHAGRLKRRKSYRHTLAKTIEAVVMIRDKTQPDTAPTCAALLVTVHTVMRTGLVGTGWSSSFPESEGKEYADATSPGLVTAACNEMQKRLEIMLAKAYED